MSPVALTNGRVLTPTGFSEDCVVIEGDRIAATLPAPPADAKVVDLGGKMLLPGFIDTQVNGGGGRLFNDDPSVETLRVIAETHRRYGTTGMLPTLISDDLDVVAAAIAAVDAAIEAQVPGILGIHIEGPFLSPKRKGIHPEGKLQPLRDDYLALLTSLKRGKTLVTLAPERATPDQIRQLVAAGVIVSAGHSDAPYETVRAAIDAGLTGFTHIYNAMSQLTGRAPGMVGAALESGDTFAGIIADGHHLHPASLRIALAAKGPERLMLVTDAMPSVGSDAPGFELQGRTIHREGDRLVGEDGTLAGSTLTMAGAVRGMIDQGRVSLETAVAMASATPAAFLSLATHGGIAVGQSANLLLADGNLNIEASWIAGIRA
ncbi:MAG: N-acetylglucosamine-6-phosphate deacetylase [Sphingomonas sp.]|uniref:N-acetylglucosamine-6-phosphate deacetylase n=1 Tax=Sphingomonas sp. TaxID=28214 RepID=UPI0025DFFEFA|nr:N-acetylglucosamine-6-phosphate deacetylase [Sphingomonas sp.]MBX3565303.1 N-acetylglucosamine-6-phosphate deacetylase [Sphingomonas sp.]